MKKNVTFILVFLSWILVNPINLFSQTIIYQTGFENIKDSAMLGKSLANDGWLVNDSSIQKTAASIPFGSFRPVDEFRMHGLYPMLIIQMFAVEIQLVCLLSSQYRARL